MLNVKEDFTGAKYIKPYTDFGFKKLFGSFLFNKFFIAIVIVFFSVTAAVAQTGGADGNFNAGITSPEGGLTCNVQFSNGQLTGIITLKNIDYKTVRLNLGVKTNKGTLGTSYDSFVEARTSQYNGSIVSNIAEKKSYTDRYNEIVLSFKNSNSISYDVTIRTYEEGVAVKYDVKSTQQISITDDLTSLDLIGYNPTCYSERNTESGYSANGAYSSGSSIAPLFINASGISALMNEANNPALAAPLTINFRNSVYTFSQTYSYSNNISTSWRYCVFGENPVKMLDGKYILWSLNQKNTDNTNWIKPGKTFRACITNNYFHTDSVKNRIDFAQKMHFGYVLLDAGWYGLGYSKEHNSRSNPLKPVSELNIQECCRYANEKGIGIILYVNKVAWQNYDNTQMLDLYKSWGVKGLKLGFMDGKSKDGLRHIYSIIKGAYDRQMIVNVHDEIRQTGLERQYPNLMTTEGIKGNEHRENKGDHTSLLPFSRYMSGSGDYTICYKGYPDNNEAYKGMTTTKGHQLALATAFFCPIQHIFWYGKPNEYPKSIEIEYFRALPTVWDDTKVLEGKPCEYFSIARKSGDKWFVSTHTYQARTAHLCMDFLDPNYYYYVAIYEDTSNSIRRTVKMISSSDVLELDLKANGGAVALVSKSNVFIDSQDDSKDEPKDEQKDEPKDDNQTDNSSDETSDNLPTPTSEIQIENPTTKVWAYDRVIYIESKPNLEYSIIDVNGRVLKIGVTNTNHDEVRLGGNVEGVVIVIINGKSFKIRY